MQVCGECRHQLTHFKTRSLSSLAIKKVPSIVGNVGTLGDAKILQYLERHKALLSQIEIVDEQLHLYKERIFRLQQDMVDDMDSLARKRVLNLQIRQLVGELRQLLQE